MPALPAIAVTGIAVAALAIGLIAVWTAYRLSQEAVGTAEKVSGAVTSPLDWLRGGLRLLGPGGA